MKICISIAEKTQAETIKVLKEAGKKADFAEILVDQIGDLDLRRLFMVSSLKLVISGRAVDGRVVAKGTYSRLAETLIQGITLRAQYIDIPLRMPKNLNKKIVQYARRKKSKVIISHHDFIGTPKLEQLQKIADRMKAEGGDVVKIATTAKTLDDVIALCALAVQLKQKRIKHILIAMGKKGQLSRILTPTLGGEMMFACLSKKRQTASGQMTADELRRAWDLIQAKV